MTLKYILTEPLLACTEKQINGYFDVLDDWSECVERQLTLDDLYNISPGLSGGEAAVIFKSWKQHAVKEP